VRKRKIVYLSVDFGSGHNSAVQAIQESIDKYYPDKYDHKTIDVVALIGRRLDNFIEGALKKAHVYAPFSWKTLFELSDKSEVVNHFDKKGYPIVKKYLKPILDERPDIIISCYPFLAYSISRYLDDTHKEIPLVMVVTDSGDVHSSWINSNVDHYLAQNNETAFYLRMAGVEEEKINVLGFPLRQIFYKKYSRTSLRDEYKVPKNNKLIFYFNGAWGLGKVVDKLKEMDAMLDSISIIVNCGTNEKLIKKIKKRKFRNQIIPVGYIDNVPEMISAADLVISKAGGASIMEIITLKTPLVVTEVLPGQEEPNARFIESMGFGYVEKSPKRLAETVKYILETDDLKRLKKNITDYKTNDKADQRVADFIDALG